MHFVVVVVPVEFCGHTVLTDHAVGGGWRFILTGQSLLKLIHISSLVPNNLPVFCCPVVKLQLLPERPNPLMSPNGSYLYVQLPYQYWQSAKVKYHPLVE